MMENKTVIITGSNTGIGKETALGICKLGATVILAVRNVKKGEVARDDILATAKGNHCEVHELDVSSMASVRKFAAAMKGRRIDILINNAAVADLPRQLTKEGLELTVATNHLGHFLLSHLLLPQLQATRGRIVNVASIGHFWSSAASLDIENDLKYERSVWTMELYLSTKLMNVLFSNELAKRLKGTGVTSNALCPGAVKTSILRHTFSNNWWGGIANMFNSILSNSPEKGAQTSIYVAVSDELKGVSGAYFTNGKSSQASKLSQDETLCRKLWEVSEKLVKLKPEEKLV
ncbi:unnamed protein product [Meganyctiphanes norvegica]|uniref:Retinol dehydrogenase 11 n=1 Tax=Meganyctiphanes norvegica TaxID=48144 RepID=A0AAV2SKA5_MEGNR